MVITRRAYTMSEAAIVLGVSRSTLHRQIQAGQIPHIRIGRNIRISHAQLNRVLEDEGKEEEAAKQETGRAS